MAERTDTSLAGLYALAFLFSDALAANSTFSNRFDHATYPIPALSSGVTARVCAYVGHRPVVIAADPLAIFRLDAEAGAWRKLEGAFPAGIRVATNAVHSTTPDGLVVFFESQGGVQPMRLVIEDGRFTVSECGIWPATVPPRAATFRQGAFFAIGSRDGRPTLYRLREATTSAEWVDLGPIPFELREPLVLAPQREGDCALLFVVGRSTAGNATTLSYDPHTRRWSNPVAATYDFEPAAVAPVGIANIAVLGNASPNAAALAFYNTNAHAWTTPLPLPFEGHPVAMRQDGAKTELIALAPDGAFIGLSSTYRPARGSLRFLDYLVLGAFFVGLVWVSLSHTKVAQSADTYFRGGKSIPWLAAGMSVVATRLSSTSLVSIPAKAFATNLQYALIPLTNFVGAALMSAFFVRFFVRLNVTSGYEYLEKRFSVGVRTLGSVNYLAYELSRVGLLILVPAVAVAAVTDFDLHVAIIVMGVVATAYTMIGGLEGVVKADVYQICVKIVGLLLAAVLVFAMLEGHPGQWLAAAHEAGRLRIVDVSWDFTRDTIWVFILFWLTDGLKSYVANQTIIQRFISTRDERAAQSTIWASAFIGFGVTMLLLLVGTGLFLYYQQNPEKLDVCMSKPDGVFPWFIVLELPMGVAGLLIAALVAAAMSSLDGALNSTSTVIVTDFYKRFWRGASDSGSVKLGRILTGFIGLGGTGVALLLSGLSGRSLFDAMLMMIGLFGGGLGGLFLLGMLSARPNGTAALIGFSCSVVVQVYVATFTPLHFLVFMFTGMSSCILGGWLAGFIFPERRNMQGLTVRRCAT
jgi:SSS family transporter